MSNPTNPFSWQMPTPTDLVTDLPADFEVFGQAVATSLADLLGGTSGQILAKNSNTDMDFVWIANDQGDITAVTAGTGISGGGTSGAVTITNSMATEITASGDIIVGTGSGTFDNLPIGTTGQVLTADTTVSPYKVKWETPSAGGASFYGCQLYKSVSQSTANNTSTALTFQNESVDVGGYHSTSTNTSRITIPTGKGGTYLFTGQVSWATAASGLRLCSFYVNGSIVATGNSRGGSTTWDTTTGTLIVTLVAGDYVELYGRQNSGGSLDVVGEDSDNYITRFGCVYLGA